MNDMGRAWIQTLSGGVRLTVRLRYYDGEGNGEPPHYFSQDPIIMTDKPKTTALSSRQTFNGQRVLRISGSVMKIATWNVRSMSTGKLQNVDKEMQRLNIDILGISELRWSGSGLINTDHGVIYYSGNLDNRHPNGVGIMINNNLKSCVKNFIPISDRILLLQLKASRQNVNIIQVYAPTADKSEDIIEEWYDQLRQIVKQLKKHEVNLIIGDFNAKVGQGRVLDIVGEHGLGSRNERGDRLIEFCQEENLMVANTFFKLPPRRLYTWKSPADSPTHMVRNQIDFVIINKRFRNNVKSVKTYPGADVNSDHNPLVAKICLRLKSLKKKEKMRRLDVTKLKDINIRNEASQILNKKLLEKKDIICNTLNDVDQRWNTFRDQVVEVSEKFLKPDKVQKKKEWMTEEILDLMSIRRTLKNKDADQYKNINNHIRRKIRNAKESMLTEKCKEIEMFQARHDLFNMHKKIKEAAGLRKSTKIQTLIDKNGNYALCLEDKLKMWKEYVEELFQDNRPPLVNREECTGPAISKEEVLHAINVAKNGKTVGPDGICTELLKELNEAAAKMLKDLFNAIYDAGHMPQDWVQSTFVTLPKSNSAKRCEDYRTISLMSHVLKIFLKIIHNRIYKKCEENISETQFGFRKGLGTRDALFALQILVQRCWDVNKDVYLCFIDYEKAFDRVQHSKLIEILKNTGIDSKDLRIITNLYWNQTANVKIEGAFTDTVKIMRGVRQGCVLSPLLFNMYAEAIFTEALENSNEGILVNGVRINNIRYADDTVLITSDLLEMQSLLDRINTVGIKFGLHINIKKTKLMIVSRRRPLIAPLRVNDVPLDCVEHYKYLGCILNERWDFSQEIRIRIEQARSAYSKLKKVLTNRDISLELRTRVVRCYVFSVLLYGVESWTLTQALSNKIEAFEMWVYRRILRVSWTERVTNMTILGSMNKKMEVLNAIKRRKLEYLGHIMRNKKYNILQIIMQGKIEGSRRPGRRRTSWLYNLRQWFGKSTKSLFRAAVSRVRIAMMVTNLR